MRCCNAAAVCATKHVSKVVGHATAFVRSLKLTGMMIWRKGADAGGGGGGGGGGGAYAEVGVHPLEGWGEQGHAQRVGPQGKGVCLTYHAGG